MLTLIFLSLAGIVHGDYPYPPEAIQSGGLHSTHFISGPYPPAEPVVVSSGPYPPAQPVLAAPASTGPYPSALPVVEGGEVSPVDADSPRVPHTTYSLPKIQPGALQAPISSQSLHPELLGGAPTSYPIHVSQDSNQYPNLPNHPQSTQINPLQSSHHQSNPLKSYPNVLNPLQSLSNRPIPLQSYLSEPNRLQSYSNQLKPLQSNPNLNLLQLSHRQPHPLKSYPNQHNQLQSFSNQPNQLQTFSNQPNQLQSFSNKPNPLQSHPHQPNQFQAFYNQPNPLQSYPDQPNPLQSYPNQPNPLQSYPNQPNPLKSYPNHPNWIQSYPSKPQKFSPISSVLKHPSIPAQSQSPGKPNSIPAEKTNSIPATPIQSGSKVSPEELEIPSNTQIKLQDDRLQYSHGFSDDKGTAVREQGSLLSTNDGWEYVVAKKGSYEYTSPEGKQVKVNYIADDKGYRVIP